MTPRRRILAFVIAGLAVSAFAAFWISPFASSEPDGLQRVAIDKGFVHTAKDSATADAPLAHYAVSGVDDQRLSTGTAGLIGVGICFTGGITAMWLVRRVRRVSDDRLEPNGVADEGA